MSMETKIEKRKRFWNTGVWLTLIGVTVTVCVLLIRFWKYLSQFEILIYVGLFFTAMLAGSPIPIPTPCMALTFTLGSKFDPWLIGVIAATGEAIGLMLVYFAARTGRHFMPNLNISDPANKIYSSVIGRFLRRIKVTRFMEFVNKRGAPGVFLFSIFPNPFLMPLLVTMGINRYRAWSVAIACWLGSAVLFLGLALIGHYGLGSILRQFALFKIT
jgi:uncharacterized membrane protein YdjX (TVP38/TMEM64 family)